MADRTKTAIETHRQLCRPWLEALEARLPPGDTLLGLLVAGDLLDEPISDSSLDSDSSFILHPSSFDAEHLVTWPTPDTMWPGDPVAATVLTSTTSDNSKGHLANSQHTAVIWPPALTIAPHRATTAWNAVTAAQPSFPNSGSGTPLRETPFRGAFGDETEFLGGAFPNGSSGTRSAVAVPNRGSGTRSAEANYGSLPFYFEQNVGQADKAFDFLARGQGYALGLSPTEATFSFQSRERQRPEYGDDRSDVGCVKSSQTHQAVVAPVRPRGLDAPYQENECGSGVPPVAYASGSDLLHMQLVGANPAAQPSSADPFVTKVNYFLGNDPNKWHPNVPTFAKVQYDDVYPGIDLVYYSTTVNSQFRTQNSELKTQNSKLKTQNSLEYDFIVSPGADPNQIHLNFTGADSVKIDTNGDLVLSIATDNGSAYGVTTDNVELRQQKPYLYQEVNGQRQQVAGAFRIQNSESSGSTDYCLLTTDYCSVAFDVGAYDPSRPLVIDPVIAYSTYLGGSHYDYASGVAVDKAGSAYIVGATRSIDFPLVNPLQPASGGANDVFVAKFSPSGTSLIYATYLGGTHEDYGYGIAVDSKGSAYVTGATLSGNFPSTAGAFQPRNGSDPCLIGPYCADAFVTRLSPTGTSLLYSSYLGGEDIETGNGIALDKFGNAYLMGQTQSSDFPTLNAVQPTYGGGGLCEEGGVYHDCSDAFVTKVSPNGSALIYSTYLGGNRDEGYYFGIGGIAVDPAGHAYVTGETLSANFPTFNAIQPIKGGPSEDAFVAKLSPQGSAFVYSTYLGGDGSDTGFGIATDSSGNGYVTGRANSTTFPLVNPFQSLPIGGCFVSKFKADGSALMYSTYLGGNAYDACGDIVVDAVGSATVSGVTDSKDFPILKAFQPTFGGGDLDAFVTKFAPPGNYLVYSSYLGGGGQFGNGNDSAGGIALDRIGNAYVAGYTLSTSFPTVNPLQAANAGYADAFVTKIRRHAVTSATAQPLP